MNDKIIEVQKLMKKNQNDSTTINNSINNNYNSSNSNTNNNSINDNSNNLNSNNDNNSNEGNTNDINENSNYISENNQNKNLNVYLNVSNDNQGSFSFLNSNNNEQQDNDEDIIEMIYIVDKDKYFEEKNILNTFDIKLNVHIDHTQKDKIFFYDYDYKEDGNFGDKKQIYRFKCSDSNCQAVYQLNLNENKNENDNNILFSIIQEHSLDYNMHDYNNNPTKGQNKYQEIMTKYPNIKHIQIITVPDNFDFSTIPSLNDENTNEENNEMNDLSLQKNQININVDDNEDEKYSLESELYDKNKIDKEDDDDYYSNTSSYKARSRNKENKKKITKKIKMNHNNKERDKDKEKERAKQKDKDKDKDKPKGKRHKSTILEDYERYIQSGVKQIKKKRQQLYYKPQEYTKFTISLKNPRYVYAYLPYYKKGREALGKSKAREKWLRYMAFKYGEETTLGPIYYKDKTDGKIYKFAVNNLSSDADNRKVTYSCFRDNCQGRGVLNVENDIFTIIEPHSLRRSLCTDIKRHQAIVDYYNGHPDIIYIQTLRVFQQTK